MSMPHMTPRFTVEEYLAIERAADERYFFYDGEIYAMAGESDAHGDITVNVSGSLYVQLRGKRCRVRSKDTKVRSGPSPTPARNMSGLYSYPDVLVVCGEPEYMDDQKDVILNPSVIIEVLSPATESFDRGEKCQRYQTWNTTMTDYILVAQDKPMIEHFTRQGDNSWNLRRYVGLEAEVSIASIQCSLKLADVYERVGFARV